MQQKLSNKERMAIPKQVMPEQDKDVRRSNFLEVNLGLTEELAKMEALRCLQCPKPVCVEGCPVGVKIKDFIMLVAEGKYLEAAAKIKEDNMLPAICGRVCPQEEQCITKNNRILLITCSYSYYLPRLANRSEMKMGLQSAVFSQQAEASNKSKSK